MLRLALALAASLAVAACGGAEARLSAGRAGPATAAVPTQADEAATLAAFVAYWNLPATCPVTLGSPLRIAYDSSGTGWSVAPVVPAPSCMLYRSPLANERPGPGPGGGYAIPALSIEAFGTRQMATFSKGRGAGWVMDGLAGSPFPCPAPQGIAPGPTNGSLPSAVVRALGLHYATNCASVYFDPGPAN